MLKKNLKKSNQMNTLELYPYSSLQVRREQNKTTNI